MIFPGVPSMGHHGYEAPPVCPVPLEDVPVRLRQADGTLLTWWTDGWIYRLTPDGTETKWVPPPTLKEAVDTRTYCEGRKFFQFRSNGDIIVFIRGEPFFFSGKDEEVPAVEGEVLPAPYKCYCESYDNWLWIWDQADAANDCRCWKEDTYSDRWSSDNDSDSDRGCHCCYDRY